LSRAERDIKRWLEELGLGQYAQSFAESDIDFDVLPELTESELESLGLSLGHRKRLRRAIAELMPTIGGQISPSEIARLAADEVQAERRQVTVMFCDLVGSTEMSTRLDPEDFRNVLRAYQRMCAEVIRRYDGFVAQYLGDGVLAYFGYPNSHEDEAERAVRAGLALLASSVPIVGDNIELRIRIGVATGPTLIGDLIGRGSTEQIAVTGKTPNLAARIQEVAQPATLVITESTRRLVDGRFKFEDLGAQRLKGISEPVQVWRVVRELSDVEQFAAKRTAFANCVGRDRELRLLLDRWRLTTSGAGQAVVILGEAGIGKTRLVALLRERLSADFHIHVRLQCAQQYRNSPLRPVIVHLRKAAGYEQNDAADMKLAKIEQLLAMAGSRDGAPLVAALLSVPFEDRYAPLAISPVRQRAKTLELLVQQMVALAAGKPVLLVVEDVHWVDPTTEDLLIRLLDRVPECGIMVLLTARPDDASRLIDHPHAITLGLGRLGPDHSKQIILEMSGGKTLPNELIERVLVKTDGVPLFIEELTKDVVESWQLRLDVQEGANSTVFDLSIPSSLEDALRARIDRLSSVKQVLQVGAALGRNFSYALIRGAMGLEERDLHQALDRLVEAKLIYQHGAPPEAVYTFKHALVQDAAYESMLRSQRTPLHARIVGLIENQFSELMESEPELIAHHCSRAELGGKAIGYWLKAGANAVKRSANLEAIDHLRNGLQRLHVIRSGDERARLELELQLTLGQALIAARGYTAAETGVAFARAEQLVGQIGDAGQRYSTLYGIFVRQLIGGHIDDASATSERLHRLASTGEDGAYLCLAYRLLGSLSFFRGALAESYLQLQKAVTLYEPSEQRLALHFGPDTGPAALIFLAMTEWLIGKPESALRTAQNAIAKARQLENALTLAQVLTLAAQLHYMSQDYETMFHLSKESRENCELNGIPYFGSISKLYQLWAQASLSDSADYIEEFQQSLAAYEEMNCGLQVALFRVMLAQLLLMAGRPAIAVKECETALAKIAVNGERWWAPEIYRMLGDTLLALSDPDAVEAEKCFRRGVAEARQSGALMLELRATMSIAKMLSKRGDWADAQRMLASVVTQFTEGFESVDLRPATALLETANAVLAAKSSGLA
jgi:class 3 adenylate cyclase/predicted ATPase